MHSPKHGKGNPSVGEVGGCRPHVVLTVGLIRLLLRASLTPLPPSLPPSLPALFHLRNPYLATPRSVLAKMDEFSNKIQKGKGVIIIILIIIVIVIVIIAIIKMRSQIMDTILTACW